MNNLNVLIGLRIMLIIYKKAVNGEDLKPAEVNCISHGMCIALPRLARIGAITWLEEKCGCDYIQWWMRENLINGYTNHDGNLITINHATGGFWMFKTADHKSRAEWLEARIEELEEEEASC